MKTVSTEIFNAIHKRSRQFSLLLDFGDFEITKAENYSQEVISSPSSGLTFGTVAIGTGSFELKKQTVDVAGKTFRAFLGVKVSNEFEQVKLGKFTVTDVQEKGITTEVAFEDDIALLDKTFDRNLTTPATAVDVLDAVASICGVSFDLSNVPTDLTIEKPAEGFVCREIVGWIAQLLGTFVAIDTSTEKICFKWYEETGYTINKDNYLYMVGEPTTDALFELGAISCNTGTETLTASADNTQGVVSLSNPFMTQAKLNALLEQRKGFSYNGGELAFVLGNPLLDAWDVVTVEYAGKTSVFACMSLSLSFSGAVTGGVKSFVRDANTSFEGTITKEINGIKTRVTVLDGILKTEIVHNDEVITSINASKEGVKIKGEHLDLEGQVTFSSLNDEVKTAIDTAGEDAEAAKTAANTANTNANTAKTNASTALSTANTANNKINAVTTTENNTTVIDGGKIATGTVTAKQANLKDIFAQNIDMDGTFTATAQVILPPTQAELDRVKKHIFRQELIPDDEFDKYDVYPSGVINSTDLLLLKRHMYGQATLDVPPSTVTVTISPADIKNAIKIEGTNYWGSKVCITIGSNGITSPVANIMAIACDTLESTDTIFANVLEADSAEIGGYVVEDRLAYLSGLTGNIQTQLNTKHQMYTTSITIAGSADYFYPVVIGASRAKDRPQFVSVMKDLGSLTPSIPGNHSNGTSSLWLQYELRSNTWDGNGGYAKTLYKSQPYGTLVSHTEFAISSTDGFVVYLRGGGCKYNISSSRSCAINVYYERTNISTYADDSPFAAWVTPRTDIGNGGLYSTTVLGYGNIQGNATTASAVPWSGVTSKPSYYDAKAIKSITRSGTTFTYTCMDGTTGTFTQQDNNTTYTLSSFGITATATELNYTDGVTSNIQTQLNGKAAKVVVLFDGSASNQLIQGQSVSINMSAYRSIRVYYHMPGSGGVKETHMMYKTGMNKYPDYYYDGIYAPTPDNVGTGTRIMCMLWGINEAKTTFTVRRCGWFDNPSSTWNERANSDYGVIRIEGVI